MPAPYAKHRRQLELILEAWGMEQATAAETAEIMAWADLHGIDTHGISMVPPYDERRRAGTVDMTAQPKVTRDTPVSALVDGGGGLGHPAARLAMNVAIDKARKTGVGIVPVHNSNHFGACGFYALMAVEAGLIGIAFSNTYASMGYPGLKGRVIGTDPATDNYHNNFQGPEAFLAAEIDNRGLLKIEVAPDQIAEIENFRHSRVSRLRRRGRSGRAERPRRAGPEPCSRHRGGARRMCPPRPSR